MKAYPVILSGGSGTRLWPLSRATFPKQFLRLLPSQTNTLFQDTALRLAGRSGYAAASVICSNEHRFIVTEQLAACACAARAIYLEPVGRNTAPAIAVAALSVVAEDRDGILVVMPSDHMIEDVAAFVDRVDEAVALAREDKFVLFGIVAGTPDTGFGYIGRGTPLPDREYTAFEIASFVEKPDAATAARLVGNGDHYWNSGVFVLPARVVVSELERLQPAILTAARAALDRAQMDLGLFRLDADAFSRAPAISFDHAVIEHARAAVVLPLDVGWCDAGSWTAVAQLVGSDSNKNSTVGNTVLKDVSNCLVYSDGRLVAGLGIEDLVIVDTRDALLVAHKDKAQNISAIVQAIQEGAGDGHETSAKQYRPWGHFEALCIGPRFQVKRLHVKPGAMLSRQMHRHRSEHWVVVSGTARITHGNDRFPLNVGESTYIPATDWHRIENPGTTPLEIVEIQIGAYLGEDDIVRSDDIYNRAPEGGDITTTISSLDDKAR